MASKCVHKGCGKLFSDAEEPCTYHPGPPVFHEGQKGWKCCKPRVLTFDEFMTIPPCTTGKHSTVDDTPAPEAKPSNEEVEAKIKEQQTKGEGLAPPVARVPIAAAAPRPSPSPAPQEDEDDDLDAPVPNDATCKRKSCGIRYTSGQDRSKEQCVHHPGQALFHEGSKGWTCCKRRVLEFDEFMKIPGCTTKSQHLFIGSKKDADTEQQLADVRNDFYQTATTVIASLYLKKIDKDRSTVQFVDETTVDLDLHTGDKTRYRTKMTLFGPIDVAKSAFKIMGTKMELTLAKADGQGWPVLRSDDPHTGEIIQAGRAGRV
ncbi:Cysteine and histidine-rich domain-containing protein [Acrodontium crateriforme]|uniref:Cysteine and histidine-rich domain-containing protein n=1 Tax=Acrodontium crateriforme TaxID=150365 RepID=A0AAQ3M6W1_9PEZI|nr:Cysteine and histidine-rich domain-containing protein [Acrodontium crateriforme]